MSEDNEDWTDIPELFMSDLYGASDVMKNCGFLDFSELFVSGELDEILPKFLKQSSLGTEGVYVLPYTKSTEFIVANSILLENLIQNQGFDPDELETFEGILRISEQYYEYTDSLTPEILNDGSPFFSIEDSFNYFINGMYQLGIDLCSITRGNLDETLFKEKVKILWDNYYVPVVRGYYSVGGSSFGVKLLFQNLVAGICKSDDSIVFSKDSDINIRLFFEPYFKDSVNKSVVTGGRGISAKNTGDERIRKSVKIFLEYLLNNRHSDEIVLNSFSLPLSRESYKNKYTVFVDNSNYLTGNFRKSIHTGIDQINERELNDGCYNIERNSVEAVIACHLKQKAVDLRVKILGKAYRGEDYDAMIESQISDEAFEIWYNDFFNELSEVMGWNES